MFCCGVEGPSKKLFSSDARLFSGGMKGGLPRELGPGTSCWLRPGPSGGGKVVTIEVGSCPLISGERHSGGKISGGGLGCGAQEVRFSMPGSVLRGVIAAMLAEATVLGPPGMIEMVFSPDPAHRLPPPD